MAGKGWNGKIDRGFEIGFDRVLILILDFDRVLILFLDFDRVLKLFLDFDRVLILLLCPILSVSPFPHLL